MIVRRVDTVVFIYIHIIQINTGTGKCIQKLRVIKGVAKVAY